ncbi:MAG: hypothetical protein PHS92_02460 [Candidatus Gracilibacteria bacterium]|nr:hypothetical protein [Candidatus Gracilibacteria bacterium]
MTVINLNNGISEISEVFGLIKEVDTAEKTTCIYRDRIYKVIVIYSDVDSAKKYIQQMKNEGFRSISLGLLQKTIFDTKDPTYRILEMLDEAEKMKRFA